MKKRCAIDYLDKLACASFLFMIITDPVDFYNDVNNK